MKNFMMVVVVGLLMVVVPPLVSAGEDAAVAAGGLLVALTPVGQWFGYAVGAVGAASLLVQGISFVTGITPSKTDDRYINEAMSWLAKTQRVLDRIAFNPSANKARKR